MLPAVCRREQETAAYNATKSQIAWGSQIRSYVLAPYRMVKDHRTGQESGNPDAVLDGELHKFIEAYLLMKANRRAEATSEEDWDF